MKKYNVEIDMDTADELVKQVLMDDANTLWGYAKTGDAYCYQYLEGLKTYMKYLGVDWVPPVETDGMHTEDLSEEVSLKPGDVVVKKEGLSKRFGPLGIYQDVVTGISPSGKQVYLENSYWQWADELDKID